MMPAYVGSTRIGNAYVGDRQLSRIYVGDDLVWQRRRSYTVANVVSHGFIDDDGGSQRFSSPAGIAYDGSQYRTYVERVSRISTTVRMWSIADRTRPDEAVVSVRGGTTGSAAFGFAYHGGAFYTIGNGRNLWKADSISAAWTLVGTLPSDWPASTQGRGGICITDSGVMFMAYSTTRNLTPLWRLDDLTKPSAAVELGELDSRITSSDGLAHDGTQLLVLAGEENLWSVPNPASPGTCDLYGDMNTPDGRGMVWDGERLVITSAQRLFSLAPD